MFFADVLPTDYVVPGQAVVIACVFIVLYFVVQITVAIITAVTALRRKPSIEEEFATKQDLHQSAVDRDRLLSDLRSEMHREMGKIDGTTRIIFDKVDKLASSVTKAFGDLQRDIGRLEGHVEMSITQEQRRAEALRYAVLDFLCARQAVAIEPEIILARIEKSHVLDFKPEPDEFTAALTFLEKFTPAPLIDCKRGALGGSRFYQATSAGVLAWERGVLSS